MNKKVLLALTIIIASMAGGCTFLGNAKKDFDESANKPIPRVKSTPTSVADAPSETEEEFADLEAEDGEATQKIAGLIPTTDADTRVRNIVRGRHDPFSVVSLVPKIEIEEEEVDLPRPTNRDNGNDRRNSHVSQRLDDNQSLSNPIDQFRTELAQQVIISGLYESNGQTKLIVRAPEEDNSRYVEVGQYLSNGQVLVKSIDLNHFPTPLVILEQSGVEISRAIGESPDNSTKRIGSLPEQDVRNQALISNISLNSEDIQ